MNLVKLNDILIRIGKEDRKAFDEFFEYYYPRLLRFAVHFVKSYENAEEVVGEVLLKLLGRRATLKNIENFNGYIFLAVKNQALSYINKKRPDVYFGDNEEDYLIIDKSNPESEFLDHELQNQLSQTVNSLPAKRKMIYKLVKNDGLKYQEVADLMNISVKTVEVHMGLAIGDIRTAIKEYLNDKKSSVILRKLLPAISPFLISNLLLYYITSIPG